jgi:hypothetical protein
LINDWADQDHYRVGNDLTKSLMSSMGDMIWIDKLQIFYAYLHFIVLHVSYRYHLPYL